MSENIATATPPVTLPPQLVDILKAEARDKGLPPKRRLRLQLKEPRMCRGVLIPPGTVLTEITLDSLLPADVLDKAIAGMELSVTVIDDEPKPAKRGGAKG